MATIHVEDWAATYGSPYLVLSDDPGSDAVRLVEDGDQLVRHPAEPAAGRHQSLAFVDGVRRIEAALYRFDPETGQVARAVAGSHACGAVVADGERRPAFARERVRRLVICGGDLPFELPDVRGGWRWESRSTHGDDPEVLKGQLQLRMRQEEGVLAERLCEEGHLVVVDGPLHYVRSRDLPVMGYVKTHSRALLGPDQHRELPRPLRRIEGTLVEIEALAPTVGRALCTVVARTESVTPNLSQRLTDLLPEAVLLNVQEDCAATRVRVLTEADVDDGREPSFQALFRDYVVASGTRVGAADRVLRYFDDLLATVEQGEPVQLPDVDRLELPAGAG